MAGMRAGTGCEAVRAFDDWQPVLSQVTKQVEDHKRSLVGLFMTQSLNGVQSGRFHGREKAEYHAGAGTECHG